MKAVFIIVAYKTQPKAIAKLTEEIKALSPEALVIVVDNTNTNRGYAAGVNEGIRRAGFRKDLYVFLNPDVSLTGISPTHFFLKSRQFDVWSGVMNQNGTKYYGGRINPVRLSGGLTTRKPTRTFPPADFVSGSLMCVTGEVVRTLQGLDERYGMYYEDVDYCLRAARAGFRVGIDTRWEYTHYEESRANRQKDFLLARSRLLFFLNYASFRLKMRELVRSPKTLWEERIPLGRKIRQSVFFVNFVSLNVSSLLNKLLNFALFLFLVRYLTPTDYGVYVLVWAQVGILGPLLDFGTTSYGLIYGGRASPQALSNLFSLRAAVSVLSFVVTLAFSAFINRGESVSMYVALTSVVFFFNMASGTYLILLTLRQRTYEASRLSILLNTVLIVTLVSVLVFTRSLSIVFVLTFLMYFLYTTLYLYLVKRELPSLQFTFEREVWKEIVTRSYIFVLIGFFAGLYFRADVFLLKYLVSDQAVGTYSAGYKFLEALVFIAASYNITATPLFARLVEGRKELLLGRIRRDATFLAIGGLAISAAMLIVGRHVLPFFLTSAYDDSVSVAIIVLFALPFILVTSVFINVLYVMKQAHIVALLFLLQIAINIVGNYLLIPRYSYFASAYLTVFNEVLNTLFFFVASLWAIRRFTFSDKKV